MGSIFVAHDYVDDIMHASSLLHNDPNDRKAVIDALIITIQL
mgnify:FL=1